MMHGREKSDSAIVAGKPTNKAVLTAAEPVERRAGAKGNASQQSTRRTQSRVSVSHALERIRQNRNEKNALPSHTQGGSRMPELGPYGSVRGALSNERPYRDLRNVVANYPFENSRRFAGNQSNSGQGDHSRLSCNAGDTQLGPAASIPRPRAHVGPKMIRPAAKPATPLLSLRWTFRAKRACVVITDAEPDRLAPLTPPAPIGLRGV